MPGLIILTNRIAISLYQLNFCSTPLAVRQFENKIRRTTYLDQHNIEIKRKRAFELSAAILSQVLYCEFFHT